MKIYYCSLEFTCVHSFNTKICLNKLVNFFLSIISSLCKTKLTVRKYRIIQNWKLIVIEWYDNNWDCMKVGKRNGRVKTRIRTELKNRKDGKCDWRLRNGKEKNLSLSFLVPITITILLHHTSYLSLSYQIHMTLYEVPNKK